MALGIFFVTGGEEGIDALAAGFSRFAHVEVEAALFSLRGESHGTADVEGDVEARADFFAEEFHGVVICPRVSGPIEVAGIIAGGVGAVVLKIDGTALVASLPTAGGATPRT